MPKKREMDVKCAEVRAGGLAERRDCLSCAERGGWGAVRRAAGGAVVCVNGEGEGEGDAWVDTDVDASDSERVGAGAEAGARGV